MKQLDIIVPIKNEADNIQPLLKKIRHALGKAQISYKVIFIDDRSTDNSLEILKELKRTHPIDYYVKKGQEGKAYSILEGVEKTSTEVVAMIDGDLQYPPEAIPRMYELASHHGIVVAKRQYGKDQKLRKLSSLVFQSFFANLLFQARCDTQSGLKLFRRSIIKHLRTEDVTPWTLDIPLLDLAQNLGYTIGEVEIDFSKRVHGKSKINIIKSTFEITSHALLYKMKTKRPVRVGPYNGHDMIGAGVIHNKTKYITHTTLDSNYTALSTLTFWQKLTLVIALALISLGLATFPMTSIKTIIAALSFVYLVDVIFNLYLILKSLHSPPDIHVTKNEVNKINNDSLPTYTILCPVYKEHEILPQFIGAMAHLDWPKNKLEVILLLEADDSQTREYLRANPLPEYFKPVIVPSTQPKTKPKACNYGLAHASGKYLVIYDVEDVPDPLQLKKVFLAFQRSGPELKCIQAKLNYYNSEQNLLTRLFTTEYSLWFDVILTGLQKLETSIPLGGTSNHFETKELIELGGWDPFNVTEDCDLGVRLFKRGAKTAIIDSLTLEEANSDLFNWLRQRSRWIKGYIQTYLVHMRRPIAFIKSQGWHSFFFQLIVGGKIAFIFINPIMWALTATYFIFRSTLGPAIESIYPATIYYMALTSFIIGNFSFIYYYMIGTAKREKWDLQKYIFFIPLYWLFTSIAGLIALYQLAINPHYWEKTIHGLHLHPKNPAPKRLPKLSLPQLPPLPAFPRFKFAFSIPKIRLPRLSLPRISFPKLSFAGGALLVLATLLGNASGLVFNSYLSRVLSLEEFGLLGAVGSIVYLASLPLNALTLATTHKVGTLIGKSKSVLADIYWRRNRLRFLAPSLLSILFWFALIPQLTKYFQSPSPLPFLLLAPIIILGIPHALDKGYLYGRLTFAAIAASILTEALTKLGVAFFAANSNQKLWVFAAYPISFAVAFLITWFMSNSGVKVSQANKAGKYIPTFPKKFFLLSFLSLLAQLPFLGLDLVLVKHYLPSTLAGQYALISVIGKIIFISGLLIAQFTIPLVSQKEGRGHNSKPILYRSLIFTAILNALGIVILGVYAPASAPLILGQHATSITNYFLPFTYGIAGYTLSFLIVRYYLAKQSYSFVFLTLGVILIHLFAIAQSPASLHYLVNLTLYLGFTSLILNITLHLTLPYLRRLRKSLTIHYVPTPSQPLFANAKGGSSAHRNLRILFFNWRDTRHEWAGGAEVYIHEIAKRLVRIGNSVTIFCGNDGKNPEIEMIDGVNIVRRGGHYSVYFWAAIYYLLRLRNKFDIVIDSVNGIPFFTPLFTSLPKMLLIFHIHQDVFRAHLRPPLSWLASFIESTLTPVLYANNKVITISESSKASLLELGLARRRTVEIINPGVTSNKAPQTKTPYPSFLYLGRLKSYKKVDLALRAFALVHQKYPQARLAIAGDGEMKKNLMILSERLGINGSATFLGKVSESEKAALYARSWALIHPSMIEGWGITAIEANLHKTPVIATDVPGLRDSIVHERTGFLVKSPTIYAFATAMEKLMTNDKLRHTMSSNAYYWAHQFSWDKSSQNLIKVIHDELELAREEERFMTGTIAYRI